MKTHFQFVLGLMLLLPVLNCGGDKINVEDGVGHLNDITISAINDDGEIDVIIPDAFFGDTLADASFDVDLNDVAVGDDLDPSDASIHDSDAEVVTFALDSVSDGDVLTITITDADANVESYSATVSADEITYAE